LRCRATHLLNTSSIRLCQPGPVDRKNPSTCGDKRMWRCTFASGFLGRPRGRVNVPCASRRISPAIATSARSNWSLVHSGASSGSTQARLVACFFPGITLPHGNDVTIRATRCPDHHHKSRAEKTIGLVPGLAIVLPVIPQCEGYSGKDDRRIRKVQTSRCQGACALGRVIGDLHTELICPQKIQNQGLSAILPRIQVLPVLSFMF
jgi:hypothetical protein